MNEHILYQTYSTWLVEKYGKKIYKLPINLGGTCPNRDGTLGTGGCTFCGGKGGGNETHDASLSVLEQLTLNKAHIQKKYKAKGFIPFFQSFSNTYMPIELFQTYMESAAQTPDVVAIAIATRPDCIQEIHLDILKNIQTHYGIDICFELGLQTANYHTLELIHRGHSLAEYIEAAISIKSYGFQLCTHLILDFAWDDDLDVVETAKIVSSVKSDFVKCHSLFIEKGTVMASMYNKGELKLLDEDTYIHRCILFLQNLDPKIVIQRIIGRTPESDSITTNWHSSWWKVRDRLYAEMENNHFYQGQYFGKQKQAIQSKHTCTNTTPNIFQL